MGDELQGKDDVRAGGLIKILGAVEVRGKWCFQAEHVVGVDKYLADLITHSEHSRVNAELNRRRLDVD